MLYCSGPQPQAVEKKNNTDIFYFIYKLILKEDLFRKLLDPLPHTPPPPHCDFCQVARSCVEDPSTTLLKQRWLNGNPQATKVIKKGTYLESLFGNKRASEETEKKLQL